MAHTESPSKPISETTDLERRVLAHERILQALIAYMSRTEPRFVEHLTAVFVEPMRMARHEHDYRDADDYAEEFIRAVRLLGDARPHRSPEPDKALKQPRLSRGTRSPRPSTTQPAQRERIQVRERNGIWEVRADGIFRGDYHRKENALAAAALLRLSPEMANCAPSTVPEAYPIQAAENEGMPPKPDTIIHG